jgi:hypothetical protein
MYFIPIGLLIKLDTAFLSLIGKSAADYAALTWTNFFIANLIPVTIGNLIGGVLLVGLVYWFIYLRLDTPLSVQETRVSTTFSPTAEMRQRS